VQETPPDPNSEPLVKLRLAAADCSGNLKSADDFDGFAAGNSAVPNLPAFSLPPALPRAEFARKILMQALIGVDTYVY
jgi:hypothetical protein